MSRLNPEMDPKNVTSGRLKTNMRRALGGLADSEVSEAAASNVRNCAKHLRRKAESLREQADSLSAFAERAEGLLSNVLEDASA